MAGEHVFETGTGSATTVAVRGEVREWKNAPIPKNVHLIDTPGLSDSVYDRQAVQEMIRYFKTLQYGVSSFLLVFSIDDIRLDAYTQNMLHLFQQLLGKGFWDFVVIVFTNVDEDRRDELEDNIEAVLDPQEGFVSEIRRIYKLSARSFVPSVVFTSTQNVRVSSYTQKHMRELYYAVAQCEARNESKRFTCPWLRQILSLPTDEQKTNFISQSIRETWAAMTANVCQLQ
ncbi:hypothetical protein EC973_005293 [Apophysomyces ossiformis]|uniref:AIG1-type G domain-containing protein n=1 Tax=Apophysomyces ossiformis TaxID=679940 RepID=A0A8H7EUT0_9FUNG|nr:hypothetical protein EC973_005293 [Apophysomyces ossiformis]